MRVVLDDRLPYQCPRTGPPVRGRTRKQICRSVLEMPLPNILQVNFYIQLDDSMRNEIWLFELCINKKNKLKIYLGNI